MGYLAVAALGYLLGCSNMALYISKLRGVDLRSGGSGNLGASNATILLGWKAGILTGIHDVLKAFLAVLLGKLLFPQLPFTGAVAGVACVLGHIFPLFMGFKGGKGFASYLGMTLALHWKLALVILVLVGLVTLITDYLVAGTTLTIVVVPCYLGWESKSWILPLILCLATGVILFKHRHNYVRIFKGTEIGLRSTLRGEHRQ